MSRLETFKALTTGAHFNKKRFARDCDVFRPENSCAPNPNTVNTVDAALHNIRPADTLDFFHEETPEEIKKDEVENGNMAGGGDDSSSGGDGNATQPTNGNTLSQKQSNKLRREHRIRIIGRHGDCTSPPPLLLKFSDLPSSVPRRLIANLNRRGMVDCTPVQMQAIPLLLRKDSVMVCAPTGSGKTVAYLLPMLTILGQHKAASTAEGMDHGLLGIVFVPTRELAVQVERELHFLAEHMKYNIMRMDKNKSQAKRQDVMVSTPSRVLSMVEEKKFELSTVIVCILDEADKLYDKTTSFPAALATIFDQLVNPNRVVGMFSATFDSVLDKVIQHVMPPPPPENPGKQYFRVVIGARTATTSHVQQKLLYVGDERGKVCAVRNLIEDGLMPPVLVFVQSVERCQEVFREVGCRHLRVATIHAGLTNEQRSRIVEDFRIGNVWVLITTDLMARGMDFKNVGTVINFDFPRTPEVYVHRVGRAGRAGTTGKAITFFTQDDGELVPGVAEMIRRAGGEVEPWMLTLKTPSKKRLKELQNTTPKRRSVLARAPVDD